MFWRLPHWLKAAFSIEQLCIVDLRGLGLWGHVPWQQSHVHCSWCGRQLQPRKALCPGWLLIES